MLFVGGGTIFPLIGGTTLLTSSTNENFKIGVGILSILGACLTALHKAFNCEAHQAECLRLINASRTLADAYENALLNESSLPENFNKLEDRREQLINSTKARPGTRYMERAISELEGK